VLWADHGYQLGDHGTWTKRTAWEIATRVPLVIRCPGRGTAGATVPAIVELLDVYPTLVDVCGLPVPPKLEGRSLAPLLDEPARDWPNVARSLIAKQAPELGGAIQGRALRTQRYRWIEWTGKPLASPVHELYDHEVDPAETRNIADTPAGRDVIGTLRLLSGG
jgi:iduronate 2-sulfatase